MVGRGPGGRGVKKVPPAGRRDQKMTARRAERAPRGAVLRHVLPRCMWGGGLEEGEDGLFRGSWHGLPILGST